MSRLDDIRARLEAATPGPWKVAQGASGCNWIDGSGYDEVLSPDTAECMAYCYGGSSQINLSDNDADLIAHAPDDLAYLLGEVERLAAERDTYREELDATNEGYPPQPWAMHLDETRAERDALAATVARVEALAEEIEYEHIARRIRAALKGDA